MEYSPVKKLFNILLAIMMITATGLSAATGDAYLEDVSSESNKKDESNGPFMAKISGDYIGQADFKCHDFSHFTFAIGEVDLSFVYYYNPCIHEGATIGVTYSRIRLDWKTNPFFTQKDFDNISLNFGGFSERLEDWLWRAQVTVNFNNIEYWDLEDYMNYDLLLWGRYAYAPNVGIHIGILAYTGMKIDRVYPIVGFDWTYDCHWKLNVIFPMDISLVYTVNECWAIAAAGRFFYERNRVKKDQFYSEGLWAYSSSGAELSVRYTPTKWITANVHAGGDFGGNLKVARRHYHSGHRLRFEGAAYAGAEVDVNF
jgi:hypothetical protein